MEIKNTSIAILIPYFGVWPSYFNIYLKSCENNDWLKIIFFTDCPIPDKKYENLTFIKSSLKEFSELCTKKLGIFIDIRSSYKVCDFRPCYGLIFEDYISEFDYWGYGDIDLIYGNLKSETFKRINDGYDILSSREEILSGSFSLFKNTTNINQLYKKSDTLIKLLSSPNYEGLDETAHNHTTWNGANKLDLPKHSFTYIVTNENKHKTIKASFKSICKEKIEFNEIIYFDDGALICEDKFLGYFHFVCNKNNPEFRLPSWENVPRNFFITETGFYKDNKFYWLKNNNRKAFGFIKDMSTRIWKRIIKN